MSQPSGSSVAIDPTSASCRSGTSSRASRHAAMTPSGSFQGSKRETCVTSGLSVRTPIHSSTWRAVSYGSPRFFGFRGSIAGGMISARRRQIGGDELRHREDRSVVFGQERAQEAPDDVVRVGGVDVRAPDPARASLAGEPEQRGRLRIVDEDEVVAGVEAGGVRARRREVPRLVCVAELDGRPLQAVVDRLRHLEERLVAADDAPVGLQALVVEQRHHRTQQLRHPAAVRRRVEVEDARAAQRARRVGRPRPAARRGRSPGTTRAKTLRRLRRRASAAHPSGIWGRSAPPAPRATASASDLQCRRCLWTARPFADINR